MKTFLGRKKKKEEEEEERGKELSEEENSWVVRERFFLDSLSLSLPNRMIG